MKHLWLVVPAFALLFPACSSTPPQSQGLPVVSRQVSTQADGFLLDVWFFKAPDDFHFGEAGEGARIAGTYTAEEGERLISRLSHRRGFELGKDAPLQVRTSSNKTGTIELQREFIYPSEYEPAQVEQHDDGTATLKAPVTPTAFEMVHVGPILKARVRPGQGGKLVVDLELQRRSFLGFVNYGTPIHGRDLGRSGAAGRELLSENRIDMPVFDLKSVLGTLEIEDGHFIALDGFVPDPPAKDKRFSPQGGAETSTGGDAMIALVRVRRDEAP